jgi:hypothetical protein
MFLVCLKLCFAIIAIKMEIEGAEAFCARMGALLEEERAAESAATMQLLSASSSGNHKLLEQRGVRIRSVAVDSVEVGLGGRTIAHLVPKTGSEFPASHRFSAGDTVVLTRLDEEEKKTLLHAVVTRVARNRIAVALQKDETIDRVLHRLDLVADEVSFRRMTAALEA